MSDNDALDKIVKMLELANNAGATEGEIKAALGRAAHMARLHNIDDVQIARAQREGQEGSVGLSIDPDKMVRKTIYTAASLTRWDKHLSVIANRATNTGGYLSLGRGAQQVIAYGLPEDVAVCEKIYQWLRKALSKQARKFAKGQRDIGFHCQSSDLSVRSFKDGFTHGMIQMLQSQEKPKEEVEIGGALVLVTDIEAAKKQALTLYQNNKLAHMKKARRSSRRIDRGAYDNGRAVGKATNISRGVIE